MMEYLQLSGTRSLDFQASDNENNKSKTPVEFTIRPLRLTAESPPPLLFKYLFSRPIVDSVKNSVIVSSTNHSKTLITVVVKNSAGEGGLVSGYASTHQFLTLL